ncbi:MAG: restriction endonuclease [Terricaulis sp.]
MPLADTTTFEMEKRRDPLHASDLSEGINRLSTGPWIFSTIIGSQCGKGLGEVVTMQPFADFALKDAIENTMQAPLDGAALELLWSATCGNAELARELGAQWRKSGRRDPEALIRLIEPLAGAGMVGRCGEPLHSGGVAPGRALVDVQVMSRALIERIARDPRQVFSMAPREFEELVADLLKAQGYEVSLTPRTRDGGKDIYAARREPLGSFRYLVECKRHAPGRPVGVAAVRALYGVAQQERANAGILMTTSRFTGPALAFAQGASHQLSLKDYFDLRVWLGEAKRT